MLVTVAKINSYVALRSAKGDLCRHALFANAIYWWVFSSLMICHDESKWRTEKVFQSRRGC
jgi:ABC-type uncharacterized transport system permease subunit